MKGGGDLGGALYPAIIGDTQGKVWAWGGLGGAHDPAVIMGGTQGDVRGEAWWRAWPDRHGGTRDKVRGGDSCGVLGQHSAVMGGNPGDVWRDLGGAIDPSVMGPRGTLRVSAGSGGGLVVQMSRPLCWTPRLLCSTDHCAVPAVN